ncbi:alpha-ketoglutarate-dependent dioxygenase AlkB [Tanacetum coccineum]
MAALEMLVGEDFQSEAAIVNYFRLGDMLGGHLDDMEVDWSKPIIFNDAEHAEIGSLEKQLSDEDDICYLEYIKTSKN